MLLLRTLRWLSDRALDFAEHNLAKSSQFLAFSKNLSHSAWFYPALLLSKTYAYLAEGWLRAGIALNRCLRWRNR